MKEQVQKLISIYNTLLQVHTCGEDSFLMTDCMRAFCQTIKELSAEQKEE